MANDQKSNDEGIVKGIQERQNALRDLGAGALSNTQPSKPAPPPSSTGSPRVNPQAQYGDRKGEKRPGASMDVDNWRKPLGSFKKGGKVKKSGTYRLHKGERVLNRKQTKKAEKKSALFGK